jgi:hypothetical protein
MRMINCCSVQTVVTLLSLSVYIINRSETVLCNAFTLPIAPSRNVETSISLTQHRMIHSIQQDNDSDDNVSTRRFFFRNTAVILASSTTTIVSLLETTTLPAVASGGATAGRYTYVYPIF